MPDVTLFEFCWMVLKMQEKNDREWVVHLVFLSQIVYFVICNIDLQAHVSVINRVGIGVHLTVFTLCSYLALFYLWSYVRVEQYTETYRSTGIFLFSCVFFAEYGLHMWRILFLTVSPKIMYTSLVVFWGIFECTRVLHQYGKNGERDLLQQQFRKDAEVMGGIIVLYMYHTSFCLMSNADGANDRFYVVCGHYKHGTDLVSQKRNETKYVLCDIWKTHRFSNRRCDLCGDDRSFDQDTFCS